MRFLAHLLAGVVVLISSSLLLAQDKDEAALKARYEAKLAELHKAGEPLTLKEMAPPEIPDDQNAAVLYQEAFKKYDLLPEEVRKSADDLYSPKHVLKDEALDTSRQAVQQAEPVLDLLRRAARRDKCRFQADYSDKPFKQPLLPVLTPIIRSARLLAFSAKVNVATSRPDQAADDCAAALKLARCVESQPVAISLMVDLAVKNMALSELREVLDQSEPSEDSLRKILAAIGDVEDRSPLLRTMKGERCYELAFIESLLKNPDERAALALDDDRNLAPPFLYSNALRILELWDVCLPLARQPWRLSAKAYIDLENRAYEDAKDYPWVFLMVPAMSKVPEAYDRVSPGSGLARQAVALRLYRLKHGAYPDKLSELVPKFLDKLPVDPFSGKDYVYRREGTSFTIYSLGENMLDDDGIEAPGKPDEGDIVWKISR